MPVNGASLATFIDSTFGTPPNLYEFCSTSFPSGDGVSLGITCTGYNVSRINLNAQSFDDSFNSASVEALFDALALNPIPFELLVGNNALGGTIPSTLTNLLELTMLVLKNTNIGGPIPAFPPKIEHIDFTNADVNGQLPTIDHLDALDYLAVSGTNLDGTLPAWGIHLETIRIEGTLISGPIPSFAGLTELTVLELGGVINGPLPSISHLSGLRYLTLTSTELGGELPELGQACNSLQHITIQDSPHLSGMLPDFSQCSDLINPWFTNLPNLSGTLPAFDQLTALKVLKVSNTAVGGTLPSAISTLPALTSLDLHNSRFSGAIPDLGSAVTSLDLSGNQLSGPLNLVHPLGGDVSRFSKLNLAQVNTTFDCDPTDSTAAPFNYSSVPVNDYDETASCAPACAFAPILDSSWNFNGSASTAAACVNVSSCMLPCPSTFVGTPRYLSCTIHRGSQDDWSLYEPGSCLDWSEVQTLVGQKDALEATIGALSRAVVGLLDKRLAESSAACQEDAVYSMLTRIDPSDDQCASQS